jgi:hypothetical protein
MAISFLCETRFAKADAIGVNLTSTHLSGSEWRYDYTVSGSYSAQDDLAIYFPYSSDSALTDLETGGSGWTTFVFQPDSALPADGEFDLVANVDEPGLGSVFSVDFSYSGAGSPATQTVTTVTDIGGGTVMLQPTISRRRQLLDSGGRMRRESCSGGRLRSDRSVFADGCKR